MQAVGYCKGAKCRDPWAVIHPSGDVKSLDVAMEPRFDAQYARYTTYAWKSCARYYDPVNLEVADPLLGGVSKWAAQTLPG